MPGGTQSTWQILYKTGKQLDYRIILCHKIWADSAPTPLEWGGVKHV